ncbi:MAG: DAK2 domain-containing protein [bacterium]|jgi:DAK2 domain fusion protein YloV
MQLNVLEGIHLRRMLLAGAALLESKKQEVNALNVFPVPDGDTGANMGLTVAAAVKEVEKVEQQLSRVAGALATGSLMGARGNSGVILSQLCRGFSHAIGSKETATAQEFARAMQAGVDTAYRAVMKPVEGTILTVAKEAAKAAIQAARMGEDIIGVLEAAVNKAAATLERTPDMLPVLKEAGVVDAGGKGLLFLLQGALQSLKGEQQDYAKTHFKDAPPPEIIDQPGLELKYQYCTEFILRGSNLRVDMIRNALCDMGDSVLAVGTEDLVKVHIHTNHPGQVLEYGLVQGTLHDIKIDNMAEQHREVVVSQKSVATKPEQPEVENALPLAECNETGISIIAVAVGEGMKAILASLGVEKVVEGGQTMNPSTEDIVRSIKECRFEQVIVLPNNKNVILAAKQAQEIVEREVVVIPTKSITQGIAALVAYNPLSSLAENAREMTATLGMVQTGEVTYAIRDSRYNGQEIKAGNILGLLDGELVEVGQEPAEIVITLLEQMVKAESEIITLYYGKDITSAAAEQLVQEVQAAYPHCEVEVYDGGQPLYYYIIAVE